MRLHVATSPTSENRTSARSGRRKLLHDRGDCRNFEPSEAVGSYVTAFLQPPEPYLLNAARLVRTSV